MTHFCRRENSVTCQHYNSGLRCCCWISRVNVQCDYMLNVNAGELRGHRTCLHDICKWDRLLLHPSDVYWLDSQWEEVEGINERTRLRPSPGSFVWNNMSCSNFNIPLIFLFVMSRQVPIIAEPHCSCWQACTDRTFYRTRRIYFPCALNFFYRGLNRCIPPSPALA